MESQDGATGAINCSGSLSLDLPPGVAVVGGRRTLMSDVDYTSSLPPTAAGRRPAAQRRRDHRAARDPGARRASRQPPSAHRRRNETAPASAEENVAASESAKLEPPGAASAAIRGRPSFDCANARTQGRDRRLLRQRAFRARSSTWQRNIGARWRRAVARAAGDAAKHSRPLPRLSRPLPEPPVHRRRLCRADARDPRHHGRPLAGPTISRG